MSELEKIFAKADKAKEMFTFPKINKKINAQQMRDGSVGLYLDGVVYPIARKLTKNIAFVRSVQGQKGQKPFAELFLKLQKVKSKSDRKKAFQTFLKEKQDIGENVSEFLYEYANARLPADKKPDTKSPVNLFAPEEDLLMRIERTIRDLQSETEELKARPPEQKTEEEIKYEPAEPPRRLRKTTFIEEKEKSAREKRATETKADKPSKKQKADKKTKKDDTPAREEREKSTARKLRGKPSKKEKQEEVVVDAMGGVREPRGEEEGGEFDYLDPVLEAEFQAEEAEEAREEAEAKREDAEPMLEREAPPPPEPRPNIQMDIEEKKDKSADRQTELNRASAEAESKREEMEKDTDPDISKHGHQIAIQNVFIKNGKDFSFVKKQLARSLLIKKSNKTIKQEIDLIYAYYSSLFPLTAKKEYSKENHLELKTLEFQYKRNIQFERSWKKNLATLRMPSMMGGQQRGQNIGIIVNTEAMGMSAGEFFQQSSQRPSAPAPKPSPLNNPTQTQTQGSANPQSEKTRPTKETSGGFALTDIKQEKIIPQTQNIKPRSSRKREKRVKRQEINLIVRQKQIKPNLLFTNPKVAQRIDEPEGELPLFTFRTKNNNRIKL